MNKQAFLIVLALAVLGYFLPALIEIPAMTSAVWFALGIIIGGSVALLTSAKAPATRSEHIDTVTLYVGNLPYRANEQAVQNLFARYGKVLSVRLMKDKQTGRRRGFGFVEMLKEDAQAAINELNDSQFQDRTLKVREAKERKDQDN
ncbi:RNA-binding protein [Gallaecimonas sp. GXIMD4217]|uniref:RNA recognition motif domain-containing protein n=1 Tax=Gallaecimonas sp. GXIMD4217 TaxID=3131927 RepID=UPI00311B2A0E